MGAPTTREVYTLFNRKRRILRTKREQKRPISEQDEVWGDVNFLFKALPRKTQEWMYHDTDVDPRAFVQTRKIVDRARGMAETARMSGDTVKRRVSKAVEDSALFRMPPEARDRIDRNVPWSRVEDAVPAKRNAPLALIRS